MAISGVLLLMASMVCGVVLALLGIEMSGAGHGWTSGALGAFIGACALPAGAAAWLARHSKLGRILAGAVVAVNLLGTALAVPVGSESRKARQVWSVMPGRVLIAAALFFGWQVLPIAALIPSRRSAR